MENRNHIIMGSAGHIDHGKTTLIQRLTGFNCDTHKEEKVRGITINLGFTYLKSDNDDLIGIIDVPGHADFINTMISGASGIDFVTLVIAADSGVMPQTEEHLQIMELLGIKKGFVVLTKVDLLDQELMEIVEEEVKDFLRGTFLENSPIIKVSSKTGAGIPELKDFIFEYSKKLKTRETGKNFRLFIDRIFNAAGFGLVVTGTVISGSIHKNHNVFLLPSEKKFRVRKIERHKIDVDEARAGDRASLNLVGLERRDFSKGMVLSDRLLVTTKLIDVKLKLLKNRKAIKVWTNCIFISGTFESQAKIHLMDKDRLEPGESALAQIHLKNPAVVLNNDKFIVRSSSADITYGGGVIIDSSPLHHKKRTKKVIDNLHLIAEGNLIDIIKVETKKRYHPISLEKISFILNTDKEALLSCLKEDDSAEIKVVSNKHHYYLLQTDYYKKIYNRIIRNLKTYHKNNPLDQYGRSFEELLGLFSVEKQHCSVIPEIIKIVLDDLKHDMAIEEANKTFIISGHKVNLDNELKKHIDYIEKYILSCELKTPLMSEMEQETKKINISMNTLNQILKLLVQQGKAYNIEGNFIHSEIVNSQRVKLIKHLSSSNRGITVAEFRDLIRGNRKICLLLLNQFDTEGTTIRKDDYRFLKK